jgi:integrase
MGKRPGFKYAALQRLDALMAIGEKRAEAKAEAQRQGASLFAFTDGKIHSFQTRQNYQQIVMRFLDWCRETHDVRDLARLDARADELASLYLSERIEQGYSAWTLQTERAALRLFFQDRNLATDVTLPQRKCENIVRSRRPAVRDKHFQPENCQPLIRFCRACGLRREELRDLKVRDVYVRSSDQHLIICVVKGKGGKWREVPVFPGREQDVLVLVEGRDPDEHVFARLPCNADIHMYRRQFAQDLYEALSGRPLPPTKGRLHSIDLDRDAALQVSRALGHNRLDIVFSHYLK